MRSSIPSSRRRRGVRAGVAVVGAALSLAAVVAARPWAREARPGRVALVAPHTTTDTAVAPAVGAEAPDFTGSLVGADGRASAVALRSLRGRVVVLAFYPKDRSQGCTLELTRFRDEFATLFGDGVSVLPVSLDDVPSHAGWAAEMRFPFPLVSDSAGDIARLYGSIDAGKPYANRTVFVIDRHGRVVWRELHFRALDEHAYQQLAAAVAGAKRS